MKNLFCILLIIAIAGTNLSAQVKTAAKTKAVFLENISWTEAEKVLKPDSVVVIALGAQAKEHGPHLPLAADFIQAEYIKNRIAERSDVVIAPTMNYGYYPAFTEYQGSTTLRLSVTREMIMDVCRSFMRFGVRRFYIINIGISTKVPLEQAANLLRAEGVILQYTDLDKTAESVVKEVKKEEKGTHADEIETSIMLYIAPARVDMKKAPKDYGVQKTLGPFTRNPQATRGIYVPTGVFGDATLATREKGKKIVEAMVEDIAKQIEDVRRSELPKAELFDENIIGQYEIAPNDTVTIAQEEGFLTAERKGIPKAIMLPLGKYRFGVFRAEATFFTDTRGKITHMIFSTNGQDFLAKKIK